MVRERPEAVGHRPGGVADVDTGDATRNEDPFEFGPHRIEHVVHQLEGTVAVAGRQGVPDGGVQRGENAVPHLDHRIRRGCDDEFDAVVGEGQLAGVPGEHPVARLHTDATSGRVL